MNKKDLAVSKSKVTKQGFFDDRVGNKDSPDSTRVIKGTNVDYTRFTLLFKLRSETKPFDSIDVVHTSQYRTIIETDQARLNHKLDTLISNVLMVFIRESHNSSEYVSVIKRRNNAIKKYLRHAGIAQHRIKIISRVE
ncbi:MAG TPA: hypothetical protein PL029_07100 [Bacteroidia bacterium]|nr:hypothetical protein [Bacteroidia bacterium]